LSIEVIGSVDSFSHPVIIVPTKAKNSDPLINFFIMLKIIKISALLYFWDCSGQIFIPFEQFKKWLLLLVFGQVKATLDLG